MARNRLGYIQTTGIIFRMSGIVIDQVVEINPLGDSELDTENVAPLEGNISFVIPGLDSGSTSDINIVYSPGTRGHRELKEVYDARASRPFEVVAPERNIIGDPVDDDGADVTAAIGVDGTVTLTKPDLVKEINTVAPGQYVKIADDYYLISAIGEDGAITVDRSSEDAPAAVDAAKFAIVQRGIEVRFVASVTKYAIAPLQGTYMQLQLTLALSSQPIITEV